MTLAHFLNFHHYHNFNPRSQTNLNNPTTIQPNQSIKSQSIQTANNLKMATISEDDEKRIRETSEMIKNLTEDLQQFQVSGVTAEVLEKVLETVEYLTGMSLSQNREFRHTATASGLSLSTGFHHSHT